LSTGDEVLLTSTDYAASHSEVRRIKSKPTTTSITLDGNNVHVFYNLVWIWK